MNSSQPFIKINLKWLKTCLCSSYDIKRSPFYPPDCPHHPVCDWHCTGSRSTGTRHRWSHCCHRNPHPLRRCKEKRHKGTDESLRSWKFVRSQNQWTCFNLKIGTCKILCSHVVQHGTTQRLLNISCFMCRRGNFSLLIKQYHLFILQHW